MEVVGYQLFIFMSLMLVKIFSPKNLLMACYVWTGFTVFNLFYWPLIFLQLFVVWGTYGLIISNGNKIYKEENSPGLRNSELDIKPKNHDKSANSTEKFPSISKGLKSLNSLAERLNDYADTAAAIEKATANVRNQLAIEKSFIDLAMNSAQSKVEIDNLNLTLEERVLFEETQLRIKRALEAIDDSPKLSENNGLPFEYETPIFVADIKNMRVDIADAVERVFHSLAVSRDEYIGGVVTQLKINSSLKYIFLSELDRFAGPVLCDFFRAKLPDNSLNAKNTPNNYLGQKSSIKSTFGALLDSTSVNIGKRQSEEVVAAYSDSKPASDDIPVMNVFVASEKLQVKENVDSTIDEGPISYLSILSFPTPKSENQLKIKNIAWSRRVPFLVHFTRAVNLPTIMTHGICSIERSKEIGLSPSVNDEFRMDGYLNAASFSISFPNSRMFYKYRMLNPSEEWVVLIIRPQVLWDKKNAFCSFNAADTRVKKRVLSELSLPSAFEQMFEERDEGDSRVSQGLMAFEPTDVQAEVLVFECVEPNLIAEIIFDDEKVLGKYRGCIGNKISRMHRKNRGMFSSRGYYINSRKNV